MRRTFLLISAGVGLAFVGVAWVAAAQHGGAAKDSWPAETVEPSSQSVPQKKVDLNNAGVEELTRLPGITPILAERIAKHRPYRKLDDLVARNVLGKKQFARIREFIVVNPRSP